MVPSGPSCSLGTYLQNMSLPENLEAIVESTLRLQHHKAHLDKKMLKLWTARQCFFKAKELIILAKNTVKNCDVKRIEIRPGLDYITFKITSHDSNSNIEVELFASIKGVRYKMVFNKDNGAGYGMCQQDNLLTFSLEDAKNYIKIRMMDTFSIA